MLHEKPLPGGTSAPVTQGKLYVIPSATNESGKVLVSPVTGHVSDLLTALGLPGGTVVSNCDVPSRSTGVFIGPGDRGNDVLE